MSGPEIKSWVKPHLRARLIQEHHDAQPKQTTGSPGNIQVAGPAVSSAFKASDFKVGDRVRLKRPDAPNTGPCWIAEMDILEMGFHKVVDVDGCMLEVQDDFGNTWYVLPSWVVEKQ